MTRYIWVSFTDNTILQSAITYPKSCKSSSYSINSACQIMGSLFFNRSHGNSPSVLTDGSSPYAPALLIIAFRKVHKEGNAQWYPSVYTSNDALHLIVSIFIFNGSNSPSLHRFRKRYCGKNYIACSNMFVTRNSFPDSFFLIDNWLSQKIISGSFIPHSLLHLSMIAILSTLRINCSRRCNSISFLKCNYAVTSFNCFYCLYYSFEPQYH